MRTDFKDDVFSGSRKYNMTNNSDGTVSFTDVTVYSQTGDLIGAKEFNEIGIELNNVNTVTFVDVPKSGWSSSAPYSQTINVESMKDTFNPIYDLYINEDVNAETGAALKEAYGYLDRLKTGNGNITLYCYSDKPTVEFKLKLKGR